MDPDEVHYLITDSRKHLMLFFPPVWEEEGRIDRAWLKERAVGELKKRGGRGGQGGKVVVHSSLCVLQPLWVGEKKRGVEAGAG